jgi:hypothetical protein
MTPLADSGVSTPSWRRAFGLAALWWWLPVMVPALLGLLSGRVPCLGTYLLNTPFVPGIVPAVLSGAPGVWFFVVGGAASAAGFMLLSLMFREVPSPWIRVIQWAAAGVSAGQGFLFMYLLSE